MYGSKITNSTVIASDQRECGNLEIILSCHPEFISGSLELDAETSSA
ncbi:hypothetical protein [Rickettsia endosymbiont of Halotydeus destructor]